MSLFSWKACILGTIQVTFLYNSELFSWSSLFTPSLIYLILEILFSLPLLANENAPTHKIFNTFVHLCTMGLCLASILLFSEAKESELDPLPSLIPIFMIFLLHSVCRVLQEPPMFVTPMLNLLSPPLAVCTMSGSCSSFYISVVSSFFGAFGSSVVDLFVVLRPLSYLLLLVTLVSVYSTRRSFCALPFILALIACLVIIAGEIFEVFLALLVGNIALVATVLWNNRLLKQFEGKSV